MKILIYTFRTFPLKDTLKNECKELFIFSTFHKDFEKLKNIIKRSQPDFIIGIARSPWKHSQFEREAVNQFHGKGKIVRGDSNIFKLHFPQNGYKAFTLSKYPTDSFCNWTMYKIANYIQGREIKLSFIHTTERDIETVIDFVKGLSRKKTVDKFR